VALLMIGALLAGCSAAPMCGKDGNRPLQRSSSRPLVIAHRGASGHRPEHTGAAYELAINMGADFIEPDLVSTRDGVLIARHENDIGGTTDVATKFPGRRATKTIDGDTITGWFTEDFTLDELRTLRAKERLPMRSRAFDGRFSIPTFDEVLALADSMGRRLGRQIGVYPETKHPEYFRNIGLPLEEKVVESLERRGLNNRAAAVFIQSFEPASLRHLRPTTQIRLVQLISDPAQITPAGLCEIAQYADGVGVNSRMVVAPETEAIPTSVIRDAHDAGLLVHVWTLRPEPQFLAPRYRGDPLAEVRELAALGVDGMFGDYPDQLVRALEKP
jgi:glycerophosphoryl diester phosphodiesterase